VPELIHGQPGSPEAVEAVLDVHVWSAAPMPCEMWVDVSCRHPWASRYRDAAPRGPGFAAEEGEKDKYTRYGVGAGGVAVTPAVIESWGRLGEQFDNLLGTLSAMWSDRRANGRRGAADVKRRWLQQIGTTLVRCLHRQVACGAHCANTVGALATDAEWVSESVL
jgi:hypothetical protein